VKEARVGRTTSITRLSSFNGSCLPAGVNHSRPGCSLKATYRPRVQFSAFDVNILYWPYLSDILTVIDFDFPFDKSFFDALTTLGKELCRSWGCNNQLALRFLCCAENASTAIYKSTYAVAGWLSSKLVSQQARHTATSTSASDGDDRRGSLGTTSSMDDSLDGSIQIDVTVIKGGREKVAMMFISRVRRSM
jgi:hypothetical protein